MNTADIPYAAWRKSTHSNGQSNCIEVAALWRKSSYSNSNSNCVEVAAAWHKSAHSSSNANCVEVAVTYPSVAVRDTKDRSGPVLVFNPEDWWAFTAAVRDGEFDLG
jgi:hypothetical protein